MFIYKNRLPSSAAIKKNQVHIYYLDNFLQQLLFLLSFFFLTPHAASIFTRPVQSRREIYQFRLYQTYIRPSMIFNSARPNIVIPTIFAANYHLNVSIQSPHYFFEVTHISSVLIGCADDSRTLLLLRIIYNQRGRGRRQEEASLRSSPT